MPTYTYHCPEHGEFEEFHSITEQLEECPLCQKEHLDPPHKVTRLISGGTTFVLNGGGWANEGYK